MAKKKEEVKKEETKKKTSPKPKQYPLKTLFEKKGIADDLINEILIANGLNCSIEEVDIKLTESEFEEVLDFYNNKRL